jgi:LysR family transcriptional regulator, cyn operon transcriptional activator
MELRHLRYFVTVADAGSVSRAAIQLRVTQPALSRQIRDLETELGLPLFDRVGRRLQLTAAGDNLLLRTRDILRAADSLREHAGALAGATTGTLRLGATAQTLESLISGFLVGFRRQWPGIDVRLIEDGGMRLKTRVQRGELHLALGAVPAGDELRARPLFPVWVLAVMPAKSALARGRTLEVAELDEQPVLLLRRDFASRLRFDAACEAARIRPHVLLEAGDPHSLVSLARGGHGIAIVPSTTLFSRAGLRVLPLVRGGRAVGGSTAAVWDARRHLPVYAQAFVDALFAYTRRSYPGKEFARLAPSVPSPLLPT